MKIIEIFQKGIQQITLYDNDESNIESYTKKISELFKSGNVSILETSSKNVVLRPQYIYTILVSDSDTKVEKVINTEQTNIEEITEDIIIG